MAVRYLFVHLTLHNPIKLHALNETNILLTVIDDYSKRWLGQNVTFILTKVEEHLKVKIIKGFDQGRNFTVWKPH